MFSAKKINGKKLYTLARKGIEVERQPNEITIYDIKLVDFSPPAKGELEGVLTITVNCSSGTYIRTLAHDIGQKLGCGAYCKDLRRTAIGEFDVKNAIDVKSLEKNDWEQYLFQN